MEKVIFKKGDKVFDIRFGWGIKIENNIYPVTVLFDLKNGNKTIRHYTSDGKDSIADDNPMLSFTEYSLQNFSQKRVVNYKDYIGKWGIFYDEEHKKDLIYKFGKLQRIEYNNNYKFNPENSIAYYEYFEPLTEEQIGILGLTDKNVDNEEHI